MQFIYHDRIEAQTYYLSNTGAGWKIVRTEDAQRTQTLVPYYRTPIKQARRKP